MELQGIVKNCFGLQRNGWDCTRLHNIAGLISSSNLLNIQIKFYTGEIIASTENYYKIILLKL